MYCTTQTSSSISRDFITFGPEALAVRRVDERRAAERDHHQITDALRATQPTSRARRWLGTMMIALGTGIAGKTAKIQKQEATSPSRVSGTRLASIR